VSNQTPQSTFDELLDEILERYRTYYSTKETKVAITSLVLRDVIGEDRPYQKYEMCPICQDMQYKCCCDEAESRFRAQQRSIITKEKHE